ncbi:hypothetical protein RRF57_013181 [Xylaria bambusicola]|uniref:Uncharacterized protein n=1 Tax=Xylaria bambusicola TaxID=326684 RepID=A0AAN7V1D7_9PEZI
MASINCVMATALPTQPRGPIENGVQAERAAFTSSSENSPSTIHRSGLKEKGSGKYLLWWWML